MGKISNYHGDWLNITLIVLIVITVIALFFSIVAAVDGDPSVLSIALPTLLSLVIMKAFAGIMRDLSRTLQEINNKLDFLEEKNKEEE